jgi:hypothetical protein
VAVVRQLDLTEETFEIVLSGSFYNGSDLIRETMAETVHASAPCARLVRLQAPPVVGGVLLAMEHVGLSTRVVRPALISHAGHELRLAPST